MAGTSLFFVDEQASRENLTRTRDRRGSIPPEGELFHGEFQMINLDELILLPLDRLIEVALRSDEPAEFWFVCGMIGAKTAVPCPVLADVLADQAYAPRAVSMDRARWALRQILREIGGYGE